MVPWSINVQWRILGVHSVRLHPGGSKRGAKKEGRKRKKQGKGEKKGKEKGRQRRREGKGKKTCKRKGKEGTQAKIVHGYSQISLLVAMQIMPCSCKIHAMNMNSFVSSCPWTVIVHAFDPLTMAYMHEVKAWLHEHEKRIHAHEI